MGRPALVFLFATELGWVFGFEVAVRQMCRALTVVRALPGGSAAGPIMLCSVVWGVFP